MDRQSEQLQLEKEFRQVLRNFRYAGGFALAVLTTGAVFYHYVEKLNWLDAVYFCTITLTTVGYGDITPHTSAGKIFTVFYVLMGIGIIGTFANLFIKRTTIKRQLAHAVKKTD